LKLEIKKLKLESEVEKTIRKLDLSLGQLSPSVFSISANNKVELQVKSKNSEN